MRDADAIKGGSVDETRIRLRSDIFRALTAERGATSIGEQVALTGVSRATLYRIRAGHPPSLANAMRMAEALGVPMNVLFERVQDAA